MNLPEHAVAGIAHSTHPVVKFGEISLDPNSVCDVETQMPDLSSGDSLNVPGE